MIEFVYYNAENVSISHTLFELNCCYHPGVLFEQNINLCFQSKLADKLSAKLQDIMTVCQENFHHTQKFQKQAQNKRVKPKSYAVSDKVWLNNKYIKTK